MGRCWTCGSNVSGWNYTCTACKNLNELKSFQKKADSYQTNISRGLDYLAEVQQEGLKALESTLSTGLSEIASAIEWGFGELSWQLQQQTDVLRSIDNTIKTPSETQANEWRQMAEELRRRGVLDESEEFYLKALEVNRLDYRIYAGLAQTYLQSNKFDKAKSFLEKSLPHAPKKEIDYKSYSYRLIGHIHACEEDYIGASRTLRTSIDLSPKYAEGHYDYAQYCAQVRNNSDCLSSIRTATLAKPVYFYLAQAEKNFDPIRHEVQSLLISASLTSNFPKEYYNGIFDLAKYSAQRGDADTCVKLLRLLILNDPGFYYTSQNEALLNSVSSTVKKLLTQIASEASDRAKVAIGQAQGGIKDALSAVSRAKEALSISNENSELSSVGTCSDAEEKLENAERKVASGDYRALLDAKPLAEEAEAKAKQAMTTAKGEYDYYSKKRSEKVKSAWKAVPGAILGWPLLFGIFGDIGGCTIGIFSNSASKTADSGFVFGAVCGLLFGVYRITKQLQ